MPRADGMGFNRDVRDAVNIIGSHSRLQEIAERVLHIKQLTDHRYIFPAGEEDLEQEWFDSNVARLKQILEDIPVKLTSANFSDGQKMVMLDGQHPNSIHLAIRDAVDQKGAGLYDFTIGLMMSKSMQHREVMELLQDAQRISNCQHGDVDIHQMQYLQL